MKSNTMLRVIVWFGTWMAKDTEQMALLLNGQMALVSGG
jgi:hypothetical protein